MPAFFLPFPADDLRCFVFAWVVCKLCVNAVPLCVDIVPSFIFVYCRDLHREKRFTPNSGSPAGSSGGCNQSEWSGALPHTRPTNGAGRRIQSIAAKSPAGIIRERWYCDVYVDNVECNSSRYTDCFGVAKASLAKVKFRLPD
jgi:hypothetical protein